jgi:NAD(P)H-hydrate epimerase
MIAVEKAADSNGLTYAEMMENAGRGLAEIIIDKYHYLDEKSIFALIGSGNNGGDALVALDGLSRYGWEVVGYIVGSRSPEDPLIKRVEERGGKLYFYDEDYESQILKRLIVNYSILMDGLLGTGIRLPLREPVSSVLKLVKSELLKNNNKIDVVAVDCPSGIDCDTGEVARECLNADLTVCMAAVKQGFLKLPAFEFLGELEVVDIGLPASLKPWSEIQKVVISGDKVAKLLPTRSLDSHKGTFGTALIVAGSTNYSGAVLLAGEAAYRMGAGLVRLAIPQILHSALAGRLTEVTWLLLPEVQGFIAESAANIVLENMARVTAVLLGPGFGLHESTKSFLEKLIQSDHGVNPPMVIDADGLKHLSQIDEWHKKLSPQAVLTPHPGEMSVLTGLSVGEIQADRIEVAERFADKWGHVVVLKGAFTVVASPSEGTTVIPVASPALARAGTGDVLAGIITGLVAQGVGPYNAARIGAWIHARTGLNASKQIQNTASVLAGDLIKALPQVLAAW